MPGGVLVGTLAGVEIRLDGGNTGGAVRVGDTVRRAAGQRTPTVHALLAQLADKGFAGSPRPLGFDAQGRESTPQAEETEKNAMTVRAGWWAARLGGHAVDCWLCVGLAAGLGC